MINSSGGRIPSEDPSVWAPAKTPLPCPPWCELEQGHRFASVNLDMGTVARTHMLSVGPDVDITADESAVTDVGPIWETSKPSLFVALELLDDIDATTARKIADQLLQGASLLERLS